MPLPRSRGVEDVPTLRVKRSSPPGAQIHNTHTPARRSRIHFKTLARTIRIGSLIAASCTPHGAFKHAGCPRNLNLRNQTHPKTSRRGAKKAATHCNNHFLVVSDGATPKGGCTKRSPSNPLPYGDSTPLYSSKLVFPPPSASLVDLRVAN